MNILITNDDGWYTQGLRDLVEILRPLGNLTIVAPKYHQSGMAMAVSMGLKPIAVKHIETKPGEDWWYLDGTPASCIKFGLDEIFKDQAPDLIVSGINYGSNAGSAALYSGTLGAAKEGTLCGILSVGVSLGNMRTDADFTIVKKFFPEILSNIMHLHSGKHGVYYNVNFPDLPAEKIKGIRLGKQGILRWVKEFVPYDMGIFSKWGVDPKSMGIITFPEVEEGEKVYMMAGDLTSSPLNTKEADHLLNEDGYITITVHNIDSTDYEELDRLRALGMESDWNQ